MQLFVTYGRIPYNLMFPFSKMSYSCPQSSIHGSSSKNPKQWTCTYLTTTHFKPLTSYACVLPAPKETYCSLQVTTVTNSSHQTLLFYSFKLLITDEFQNNCDKTDRCKMEGYLLKSVPNSAKHPLLIRRFLATS